ncbi:hypothetical protein PVAP13_6KG232106 [Panicum virgatum]|uniref:Uncharacterized protein n=1 Tax=Panicum virgatum TaxID=38727 RepID=A0A8T0RCM4_PANVG|nr:hypothetical protein PVAP13_6KG232106 [Panicum virgatum]
MAATSQICSMLATAVYSRSGTVSSSFFTITASSSVDPRLANLAAIALIFPAYSSSPSLSAMIRESSSPLSVARRAVRTRSAPTNRVLSASHTPAAVGFFDTCIKISSGCACSRCAPRHLALPRVLHGIARRRHDLPEALRVENCLHLDRRRGVARRHQHWVVDRARCRNSRHDVLDGDLARPRPPRWRTTARSLTRWHHRAPW